MSNHKTSRVLIPSGSYTETQNCPVLPSLDTKAAGIRLYLNVTDAGTGSGGLLVCIYGVDKASGNAVQLTDGGLSFGGPVNSVGLWAYEMSPYYGGNVFQGSLLPAINAAGVSGAASPASSVMPGGVVDSVQRSLPFQWFAQVQTLDNSPYIYSLSVEITD
jgi:hypothetical protein